MFEVSEYVVMVTNNLIHLLGSLGGVSLVYLICSHGMADV